jgi:hypothetical protein
MGLNRQIQSSGSLGLFDITDDLVIRLVVEGAGVSNAIVVRGRIKGQSAFNTLQTVTGSASTTVTVATYEEIEIDCTVYASTGTAVKVIATSFDQDISSSTVSAGAATEAKQDAGNTSLASIDAKTPALVGGKVPVDISSISGTVEITNDVGNAIPVSAVALPLPSGASTEAKQDTQVTKLTSIDDKTPALVSGKVPVDVGTPSVTVNNGVGSPVPVSAASLPLPAGAATSANQTTANSSLSSIDTKVPANLTVTATRLLVDNSGVTQPISAASLPLPDGAATSANQSTANSSLSSIDSKLSSLGQKAMASSTPVAISSDQTAIPISAASLPLPTGAASESTLSILNTKVPANLTVNSTRLLVDGSGVTQPISGSVSVSNLPTTQNVAVTSALPAGTNNIGDVDIATLPVSFDSGNSDATTQRVVIATNQSAIPISGTVTTTITGVSTEAKQDTGNTSLSSIDGKLPALSGGRVPVDIGGNGSITITSGTITVQNEVEISNDTGNPVPISASALPLPSGAATSANQTNGSQKTQIADGSGNVIGSTSNALDVNVKSGVALSVELSQSNDSVAVFGNDGTTNRALKTDANGELQVDVLSSALPSGASTSALQTTGNSSLSSIDTKLTTSVNGLVVDGSAVTQPISVSSLPLPTGAATETTLLALNTKVPANLTVAATRLLVDNSGVTQPVSASALPLPTGAATETTLSSINGKLNSLGQKTMANSAPVVIASDQSAIPASQSGTWDISNISGTVSLPTGASTAANQVTSNGHLSNIADATLVDNAAFTDGTTRVNAAGYVFDEVAGTTLTENDIAAARVDSKRAQVLVIEDAATRGQRASVSASGAIKVDNSAVTQPISAAALPLPTDASTSALQTTGNTSLSNIDTKLPANLTVSSTRLLVDNSGVTQPVSVASLPLPSGAATESTLSGMSGKLPATLGQTTSANSLSVVVASDQSPLPISGTITSTQVAGVEDATNSSTSPLLANGVFTGAAFNVIGYVAINVNVRSDVASATGGVKVEFSTDGTNWDHSHSTTYTGTTGVGYIFNVEYKFARIVYTNGATPQTFFRLQTIFKSTLTNSSLYTLSQTVNSNMFAQLNRSIITGETTGGGGGYVNVKVNPSGAMVTATTVDTALPAGNNNIGNVDIVTLPVSYNAGVTDAQTQRVVVANDQTLPISAASLPLPAGAATSALQTTGNSAITTLSTKTGASMVAVAHDEVVVTYVGSSNRISTVTYKLATATVATLTFAYDGSDRLTGVVRS